MLLIIFHRYGNVPRQHLSRIFHPSAKSLFYCLPFHIHFFQVFAFWEQNAKTVSREKTKRTFEGAINRTRKMTKINDGQTLVQSFSERNRRVSKRHTSLIFSFSWDGEYPSLDPHVKITALATRIEDFCARVMLIFESIVRWHIVSSNIPYLYLRLVFYRIEGFSDISSSINCANITGDDM